MNLRRNGELGLALLGALLAPACSSEPQAEVESVETEASEPQRHAVASPSNAAPDTPGNEGDGLAPNPNAPSGADAPPVGPDACAPISSTPQASSAHPSTSIPSSHGPAQTGGGGGQPSGEVSNGGASKGDAGNGGTAQGGNLGGTAASGSNPSMDLGVQVDGPDLVVSGKPFHIRGVGWNPVPVGQTHPAGLDFAGAAPVDIPMMQAAGFNVVRTYEPLLDRDVLDQLAEAGMYVLNSVYPYGGDDPSVVTSRVEQVRDHPAILAWLIGNEWNYNGLYVDLPLGESVARLREVAMLIAAADGEHPIATVFGELPDASLIEQMPEVDLWGINAYRGIGFGTLFSDWAARSAKPMFLAEYGADAYNANTDSYDPDSQEQAVVALTREIAMNSRLYGGGPCVGGAVFEWADEWWKDAAGSASAQDVGGIAPGGGPFPDQTFNEEWWGLVNIDRVPRPAYDGLTSVFVELTSAESL